VEFLVGILVVLALVAIVARFVVRDSGGRVSLPRIVDDSIGMWVLRRMTGRPLGRTPELAERADPFARYRRPVTVLAPRVDPRFRLAPRPGGLVLTTAMGASAYASAGTGSSDWPIVPRPPSPDSTGPAAVATFEPVSLWAQLRLEVRPAWVATAFTLGLVAGGWLALITR
jgi:hypothetical protein